jgi:hypothetical protein
MMKKCSICEKPVKNENIRKGDDYFCNNTCEAKFWRKGSKIADNKKIMNRMVQLKQDIFEMELNKKAHISVKIHTVRIIEKINEEIAHTNIILEALQKELKISQLKLGGNK